MIEFSSDNLQPDKVGKRLKKPSRNI